MGLDSPAAVSLRTPATNLRGHCTAPVPAVNENPAAAAGAFAAPAGGGELL